MRITARTLLFMLTLPLVGCSVVGQSESSCPGKPNGYVCKGPREVYEITNSKTSLFDGSQDGLDDDEKSRLPLEIRPTTLALSSTFLR